MGNMLEAFALLAARRIASEWHSGQWSALYAFSSSGRYNSDTTHEIRRTYNRLTEEHRRTKAGRELRGLYHFLRDRHLASLRD